MYKNLKIFTPGFTDLEANLGHTYYSSGWKPMKEKKKSRRIFASLVNKEPLTGVVFETKQERNQYVVTKRQEGHTLQMIADSLGLTREMIRQIIVANQGPTAGTVRKNREAKKRLEAVAVFKKLGTVDVGKIADFIDEKTFDHAQSDTREVRAIVAGWINGVRLIDNMPMGNRE